MTEEIKLRGNRKNLTGQKFGKLTVIKPVKTINDTSRWLCKCECGNEKIVATYRLLSGRVKTCGDCFNTINFYIPKLKRLEQENKELKEENSLLSYNLHIKEEEAEHYLKEVSRHRSALEEIREIIKADCKRCTAECDCDDDCTRYKIKTKINEVLNEVDR